MWTRIQTVGRGNRTLAVLVVIMLTLGSASRVTAQCYPELTGELTAADSAIGDLFGMSASVDGDTAVVGASSDDDGGSASGSAYVFVRSDGAWIQQAKLTAEDAAAGAHFGGSVSVSGDTAVIGARFADGGASTSGSAYVFVRSDAIWTQQAKLIAVDAATDDLFGDRVCVSGDTALIGARCDDDSGYSSGSTYVFVRSGGAWTQQAKLTASDAAPFDFFGASVSLSGDTAVIGADADDDGGNASGSAYVFVCSGGAWTQQAKLTAADAAADDLFGYSVSISGDTAVIGANGDDDAGESSGSAYVFVRSGGVWVQQAKLAADDAAVEDHFGESVSISGDAAVIAAYGDDDYGDSSGSAYVFFHSGGVWNLEAKLTAADALAEDYFGYHAVSVSGDTAVIGAYGDDGGGYNSGCAHTFDLNCLGACCLYDDTCLPDSGFAACTDLDGTFHPGVGCDPDPCGPQLGACCFHYGPCEVLTEEDCYGWGGTYWLAGETCEPNPCPFFMGDVNCDHYVNMDDVPFFVDALIGGYTGCDIGLADMDNSGTVDGADIEYFVFNLLFPPP